MPRGICLTVSHIPGKDNTIADKASIVFDYSTEWKLDVNIFHKIISFLEQPDINMFASRLNFQISPYVSWFPDPHASAVDAFTMDWNKYSICAFPPFSSLENREGLVIRYPKHTRLLIRRPILLPKQKSNVHLPFNKGLLHPLGNKLRLMSCLLSGDPLRVKAFHQKLRTKSACRGDPAHKSSTTHTQSFTNEQSVDPLCPPIGEVINLLQELYGSGLGYSCLNTAVCAFLQASNKGFEKDSWCNRTKRQDGRDGFHVTASTVICQDHFQKAEIIKALGGVRHRLKEGKHCCKCL